METRVYELARMTQADVAQTPLTTRAYMARHRAALKQALEDLGFEEVKYTRYEESQPGRPEVMALVEGRRVCICFAPIPEEIMMLEGLSEEQYQCCDTHCPDCDIYYAAFLVDRDECLLQLLGPVLLKQDGVWQTRSPEESQYMPLSTLRDVDRYSPIYGGGVLFKMDKLLIPYVLENGTLPRFSVENLFADAEQGESGYYALMGGDLPTHMMLVQQDESGQMLFRRPFFFGHASPVTELELMRCLIDRPDCGVTELMDRTGRVIYAECLESVLYPNQLRVGKHYMWTLSLVANKLSPASPAAEASEQECSFYQEPYDCFTQLSGRIVRAEDTMVDGCPALVWTLKPFRHNQTAEVQVYVGLPLLKSTHRPVPTEGDVVEVEGYLYASPDAMKETEESWQDSGEVAVMQEAQALETQGEQAQRIHAPYSVAHAAVAAAFAAAGYTDLDTGISHTRQNPTFVMRNEQGYTALLYVDACIGDEPPNMAYTPEQMQAVTEHTRAMEDAELHAHHCTVRIERRAEGFATRLSVEPECPGVPAVVETMMPDAPAEEPLKDEAQACRILGVAICRQFWGNFAAIAQEDMRYTSMVNGTKTLGKLAYIRYMAERKLLWQKEQAWAGVVVDTGTIEYVGVRRPCFMMSCYGRMVGASVVTLHEGKVADIVTLPLECNASFEKDAESAAVPTIFDPTRGRLSTHSDAPSPLQRFALAYLQDCMIRKTGFCGCVGSPDHTYISDGEERKVDKVGARWVKMLRRNPSFCDMAFTAAGRVYAVCAVEVPLHPENGGDIREIVEKLVPDREMAIRMAEQYRLIPCVFPVQIQHAPNIKVSWNLWDLRTMEPVTPTMDAGEEDAPVSEWEVLCAALAEVEEMLKIGGGEMVACHDTPGLLPHVWCRDPQGVLSWMIIRPHTSVEHADRAPSEEELRAVRLTPGVPGFVVDAQPYEDYDYTKPAATRGSMRFAKVNRPLPLT